MSKKIKKTLVPKLRFPEFRGAPAWSEPRLDEISERIVEKVGDTILTTVSITAGAGFVTQAEKFSRDISGKQYKNYIVLKKGEFAYNKGNSKKFPQGCIYKLKEFNQVAVPNAFISFRFKKDYVANFYQGYFNNNYHGKQLLRFITSGARSDGLLNIRPSDFFSIKLPTPRNKAEQQKIADCFSSLDDLITAYTQKHDALKAHKKGLMQQLFPAEGETIPKLRFPEFRDAGEWNEIKLIDTTDKKIKWSFIGGPFGSNLKSSDYVSKGIRIIQLQNIGDAEFKDDYKIFTSEEKANELLSNNIYPGEIILSKMGDPVGRACLMPNTHSRYVMCSDGIRLVVDEELFSKYFIYTLINSLQFRALVEKTATGSTRKRIGLDNLKNLPMIVPKLKEQKKVAACLSSIDELISIQAKKIESLKIHKKGLMQQLFPATDEVGA